MARLLVSRHALTSAALAAVILAAPAGAAAQDNPNNVARGDAAFVVQAPTRADISEEAADDQAPQDAAPDAAPRQEARAAPARVDASSKVYFPDAITPQSVARARAQAAQQQQLPGDQAPANAALSQVSNGERGGQDVAQLTEGQSGEALAQLSQAERQVLLDAVEGTDICDRSNDIPALQELCAGRIETRSADFAQNTGGSAEDSLLGGGLDNARLATLEAAISRLARNAGNSDDFSNHVIASVALGNQALTSAQATSAEGDPTSELSEETQAVVSAIVQQLGGN
jgi:hypothetical protein